MRISTGLLLCLAVPSAMAQKAAPWELPNFSDRVDVRVTNPSAHAISTLIVLNVHDVRATAPQFPGTLAIATNDESPASFLPIQIDDLDADGQPDEVAVAVSLAAAEQKTVSLYYSTTLRDVLPQAKRVHASHRYGYNQATVALESELIGYRTYGGFFFDVQAHTSGHNGLFNTVLGYSRTSAPPSEGQDVIHLGDTLGLGGLFLRARGIIYRPPLNTPDYTHRKPAEEEPVYRVISDGPLRAIVEARLPHWTVGTDDIALRATYEIREGEEAVRCRWSLTPLRIAQTYEIGTGVRDLPQPVLHEDSTSIVGSGVEDPKVGPVALGVAFHAKEAKAAGALQTPGGTNRTAIFSTTLEPDHAASGTYTFAAAWSGSGYSNPALHVQEALYRAATDPVVTLLDHAENPNPRTLEGEPH